MFDVCLNTRERRNGKLTDSRFGKVGIFQLYDASTTGASVRLVLDFGALDLADSLE